MTDIRFARSGDVHIAYEVVGDGPIDLIYVQGAYSHVHALKGVEEERRLYAVA